MVAERLLARRVREREERGPTDRVTFDTLATWYLDDYVLRRLRTLDTARGRVANLRAVFGGWAAMRITTEAIRDYQRARRTAGAAAATVNRETSALSRMFHLGVRAPGWRSGRSSRNDSTRTVHARGSLSTPSMKRCADTSRGRIRMSSTLPISRAGGSGRSSSCGGTRLTRRAVSSGCRPRGRRREWGVCCRSRRRLRRCCHADARRVSRARRWSSRGMTRPCGRGVGPGQWPVGRRGSPDGCVATVAGGDW